jgi:hypothetical protein
VRDCSVLCRNAGPHPEAALHSQHRNTRGSSPEIAKCVKASTYARDYFITDDHIRNLREKEASMRYKFKHAVRDVDSVLAAVCLQTTRYYVVQNAQTCDLRNYLARESGTYLYRCHRAEQHKEHKPFTMHALSEASYLSCSS